MKTIILMSLRGAPTHWGRGRRGKPTVRGHPDWSPQWGAEWRPARPSRSGGDPSTRQTSLGMTITSDCFTPLGLAMTHLLRID